MIEGPIKLTPQDWAPPGLVKMDYLAPDGSRWNVERIVGDYAQMWTVNAWGHIYPQSVSVKELREKWSEYQPSREISPEPEQNDSAPVTSEQSGTTNTSSSSTGGSSSPTLLNMLVSILT